jgi:hypothetical protein
MKTIHKYYHICPDTYQSRDLSDDISVVTALGCAILNIFWVTQDKTSYGYNHESEVEFLIREGIFTQVIKCSIVCSMGLLN